MSDSLIWTMLGHLVCIAQWAAFILVDYAYLGRGRRFRHPCVWAALLALAALFAPVLLQCLACALAFAAAGILAGATGQRQCAQLCRLYFEGARLCGSMLVLYFFMIFLSTALLLLAGNGGLG